MTSQGKIISVLKTECNLCKKCLKQKTVSFDFGDIETELVKITGKRSKILNKLLTTDHLEKTHLTLYKNQLDCAIRYLEIKYHKWKSRGSIPGKVCCGFLN